MEENELMKEIEAHRERAGMSQADMARIFGVAQQNYNNWIYRNSLPKRYYSRAHQILADCNISPDDAASDSTPVGTINIPRLDVAGSMGFGASAPAGHIDVVERIIVSMEYLRRNLNVTNTSKLAMITGYGDSMEGTFSDGDLLLVDRGVSEIKVDAVYVLCLADELYIKRIQRRPDGSFLMLSDNAKYPPYEIKNGEAENFQVLGRVLLAWNARKL